MIFINIYSISFVYEGLRVTLIDNVVVYLFKYLIFLIKFSKGFCLKMDFWRIF